MHISPFFDPSLGLSLFVCSHGNILPRRPELDRAELGPVSQCLVSFPWLHCPLKTGGWEGGGLWNPWWNSTLACYHIPSLEQRAGQGLSQPGAQSHSTLTWLLGDLQDDCYLCPRDPTPFEL